MSQDSFTVYVVDDDASIRKALKRLLGSAGHHVVTYESAEDFIASAPQAGEGCLVLDIHLQGMSGLDLQEKLSVSGAQYSIVLMTAHDNPEWQRRAQEAGAVAYLRKPFDQQALLDTIERICRLRPDAVG